jgi:putative transposase
VKRACELLEVSRAAYYHWSHQVPSRRQLADDELAARIQAIYDQSRGTYGWPRVHQALRREGVHVGGKRVARIMRQRGLIGRCRRRWTTTTVSDPEVAAVDVVKRVFGPGSVELDRVWVTTSPTSGRGRAGCTWPRSSTWLAVGSLDGPWPSTCGPSSPATPYAWPSTPAGRPPAPSSTPTAALSTRRGSSPTCWPRTKWCSRCRGPGSAGTVAESWFATLKLELIDRRSWATRTQARRAVFEFIEVFYNRRRLHSSLNYMTPVEYETTMIHHHKAAQAA